MSSLFPVTYLLDCMLPVSPYWSHPPLVPDPISDETLLYLRQPRPRQIQSKPLMNFAGSGSVQSQIMIQTRFGRWYTMVSISICLIATMTQVTRGKCLVSSGTTCVKSAVACLLISLSIKIGRESYLCLTTRWFYPTSVSVRAILCNPPCRNSEGATG